MIRESRCVAFLAATLHASPYLALGQCGPQWLPQAVAGPDSDVRGLAAIDFNGNSTGGPQLVAVGSFNNVGTLLAYKVAAWDGIRWTSLNTTPTTDKYVVGRLWTGSLVVAGERAVDTWGTSYQINWSVERLVGGLWVPLGTGGRTVRALCTTYPDPACWAVIGVDFPGGLLRWDPNNLYHVDGIPFDVQGWSDVGSGLCNTTTLSYIRSLVTLPNVTLVAAGQFSAPCCCARVNNIAQWNGTS